MNHSRRTLPYIFRCRVTGFPARQHGFVKAGFGFRIVAVAGSVLNSSAFLELCRSIGCTGKADGGVDGCGNACLMQVSSTLLWDDTRFSAAAAGAER